MFGLRKHKTTNFLEMPEKFPSFSRLRRAHAIGHLAARGDEAILLIPCQIDFCTWLNMYRCKGSKVPRVLCVIGGHALKKPGNGFTSSTRSPMHISLLQIRGAIKKIRAILLPLGYAFMIVCLKHIFMDAFPICHKVNALCCVSRAFTDANHSFRPLALAAGIKQNQSWVRWGM